MFRSIALILALLIVATTVLLARLYSQFIGRVPSGWALRWPASVVAASVAAFTLGLQSSRNGIAREIRTTIRWAREEPTLGRRALYWLRVFAGVLYRPVYLLPVICFGTVRGMMVVIDHLKHPQPWLPLVGMLSVVLISVAGMAFAGELIAYHYYYDWLPQADLLARRATHVSV